MLRKTLTLAMSALLPGAFASNVSPTELTTISVSLIVQESCMIQSAVEPSPVVRPSVSCLHGQADGDGRQFCWRNIRCKCTRQERTHRERQGFS
ncbi:hypothetical protein, partial [Caballeronia sp. M23-90]